MASGGVNREKEGGQAPKKMLGSESQSRGRGEPSAEKSTWLAWRKGRELAKEHLYLVCAHCPKQWLAQKQGHVSEAAERRNARS